MSRLPGTAEGTKWKLVGEGKHSDEEIYQEVEEEIADDDQMRRLKELEKKNKEESVGNDDQDASREERRRLMEEWSKRGPIHNRMKHMCFSHELAQDPYAWEYPKGEFKEKGIRDDEHDSLFKEIKRRSDWFRQHKPELLPHNPWRWSGHPGKHFQLYNGPEELRAEILREMKENVERALVRKNYTKDGRFAGTTKREPKHTWTKQHGKQNEQTLHAAIEPAFRRADCVISLVTVIPVAPMIVKDPERHWLTKQHYLYPPAQAERNPEFGSLEEEWLKVPTYLSHIRDALENLPGCIRVGVVVEAHPSHGYGKKKKEAKPAPGELGGREERYAEEVMADTVQGNDATSFPRARPPRSAHQKKMAAARKKAKEESRKEVINDPRFSDKDPNALKNLMEEVIRLRTELYKRQQPDAVPKPAPPPKKAPAAVAAARAEQ